MQTDASYEEQNFAIKVFVESINSYLDQTNTLFYDDDDDENLPIPVYSGIKFSMGLELILNISLSLGIFYTERKLILNETLRGCFNNAKLIGEEDDPVSLHNYSYQFMNIFVNTQLVFFPKLWKVH